ncbi:hypothetical protein C0J52_17561 [Blattella germanica]|nr:hypothetical protein C0J52_17561 [Blattella germanica]
MNKLKETGSVLKGKTTGRPRVSDERFEKVRDAFVRSPSKSIRVASIEAHPEYLSHICFSDESTFHVSRKVNKHNCRIWGSENPRVTIEMERDSQKINVWCGLMKVKVIGLFFR